eukprot:5618691-Ditylum_brightwellii.AAC.1
MILTARGGVGGEEIWQHSSEEVETATLAADALTMADAVAAEGGGGVVAGGWTWRSNEQSTGEVIVTSPTKRIF